MKKFFVLAILVMVVLSACGAPTPAPTAVPTVQQPAAEQPQPGAQQIEPGPITSDPGPDPNQWYRLTNKFLGESRSLDTYSDGNNAPYMGQTGDFSGQYWKFTPLNDGTYRMTNMFLGDGRALDTYSDGQNAPFMNNSGEFTGQHWKVTAQGDGSYRLTNLFLGDGRALDTFSDGNNDPFMGNTENVSGQFWFLSLVTPTQSAAPAAGTCSDSAQLESQDPQEGVSIKEGKTFRQTWNLTNTGKCVWDANYQLVFAQGDRMASDSVIKPLVNNSITPGGSLSIYIDMQVPKEAGAYASQWQWVNGKGEIVPINIAGVSSQYLIAQISNVSIAPSGALTGVNAQIVLDQGKICTADATYFVYVDYTSNGPIKFNTQVYLTDASGQVPDGTFDGYNGPQAEGAWTLDAAKTHQASYHVSGPYGDPKTITVRINVDGQAWPGAAITCP